MATTDTIKRTLHAFVVDRSGLAAERVIWSFQDAPRPDRTYLDMQIMSGPMAAVDGMDDVLLPDRLSPSELVSNHGQESFTLSLRAFGDDAPDVVARIRREIYEMPSYEDMLKKRQIVRFVVSSVVVGSPNSVAIEGVPISVTPTSGQTVNDVRAALVTAINASTWLATGKITAAAASPAGAFDVQGDVGCESLVASLVRLTATVTQAAVDLAVVRELAVSDDTTDRAPGWESGKLLDLQMATNQRNVVSSEFIESVEIQNVDTGSVVTIP